MLYIDSCFVCGSIIILAPNLPGEKHMVTFCQPLPSSSLVAVLVPRGSYLSPLAHMSQQAVSFQFSEGALKSLFWRKGNRFHVDKGVRARKVAATHTALPLFMQCLHTTSSCSAFAHASPLMNASTATLAGYKGIRGIVILFAKSVT